MNSVIVSLSNLGPNIGLVDRTTIFARTKNTVCLNTEFLVQLRRCTYANCASHVLTVDFAPNQEATSLLHGPVSDLLTELSPF